MTTAGRLKPSGMMAASAMRSVFVFVVKRSFPVMITKYKQIKLREKLFGISVDKSTKLDVILLGREGEMKVWMMIEPAGAAASCRLRRLLDLPWRLPCV